MNRGFTLIELSIVLVIIGLLIGGILVGQSMIRTAELMQVQKNVFYYEVSAKRFKELTRYIPGDIPNANATALGLGTSFGNGTGLVGYSADAGGGAAHEYWGFFYHMERMNLIKRPKQYASASGTGIYAIKGTSGLKDNGIRVTNSEFTGVCGNTKTNIATLVSYDLTQADANFFISTKPVGFNTADAAAIDQKYDDGAPESGDIWTYGNWAYMSGVARGDCKTADNLNYNLNSTNTSCPILFCLRSLAN